MGQDAVVVYLGGDVEGGALPHVGHVGAAAVQEPAWWRTFSSGGILLGCGAAVAQDPVDQMGVSRRFSVFCVLCSGGAWFWVLSRPHAQDYPPPVLGLLSSVFCVLCGGVLENNGGGLVLACQQAFTSLFSWQRSHSAR